MSENLWDEIDSILAKENQTFTARVFIDLTPNGKTIIVIYPGKLQEKIAEAFIDKLGEPELAGSSEEVPENLLLVFPHQNLPEELKDMAEQMTTASLLTNLGFRPEGGIVI